MILALRVSRRAIESATIKAGNTFASASENGIELEIKVKNASDIAMSEVIEVYAHVNGTKDEVLNTKLCAFKRIALNAGEEKTYTIKVDKNAMTTVDDEGVRSVTGSSADIYVGFAQPDARSEELTGVKSIKLSI